MWALQAGPGLWDPRGFGKWAGVPGDPRLLERKTNK